MDLHSKIPLQNQLDLRNFSLLDLDLGDLWKIIITMPIENNSLGIEGERQVGGMAVSLEYLVKYDQRSLGEDFLLRVGLW